jgi:hypothetical protein
VAGKKSAKNSLLLLQMGHASSISAGGDAALTKLSVVNIIGAIVFIPLPLLLQNSAINWAVLTRNGNNDKIQIK